VIFCLGVIIPASIAPCDAGDWVDQRLADTAWPESRCTCFGEVAGREARDAASKLVPLRPYREYLQANAGLGPAVARRNWQKIRDQWGDAVEKLYIEHPMRELPDVECKACGGTGCRPRYTRSIQFRGFSPEDHTLSGEDLLKMLESGQAPFHFLLEPDGAVSKVESAVFTTEAMQADWIKRSLGIIRRYPGARLSTVWM
jgi:hypothetical protein